MSTNAFDTQVAQIQASKDIKIAKIQIAWEMAKGTAWPSFDEKLNGFREAYQHISQTVDV